MTLAVKALAQAAIHDPVCVMEVDPAQAARAIERDGKTEYLPISYGLRRLNGYNATWGYPSNRSDRKMLGVGSMKRLGRVRTDDPKRSGWSGWIRSLREFGGEVRKAWWTLVVSVLAVAALLILIFPHLAIPPAFAVAALAAAAEIASFVAFHNLRVSHAKQLATLRADHDAAIESAKHSHPISPAHQDAHLGEIQQIALDLKSGLPDALSFGVDATRKRHKLTCHSADTRESIENWEPVHNEWLDARSAVDQRARQVEESLNLDDGFWKVLKIVAWKRATDNRPGSMEAPINGRSEGRDGTIWAPIPFSKDPPILVAHYRDDADRDAKLAGMQAAVDGTQNWEETRRWNQADREQEAVRSKLRNALGDVINQHVLRGHCDYC